MPADPLLQAFAARLAEAPTAPLVVAPHRTASRQDVDAAARAAGRALAAPIGGGAPAAAGETVALQAANGVAFLAGLLALRRAGCAVLLLDPRTPALERARLAGELGARAALVAGDAWAAGEADWRLVPTGVPGAPPPAGTAIVKLTSGSTGAARGVALGVETLLADDEALAATMGLRADDRLLAAIPLSHSYGLSSLAVPALVRGLPLVLPERDGPFGPLAAAEAAEATVFPTVPAWLGGLVRLAEPPPLPPSIRLVLAAGAPLAAETSARFRERHGRPVHVFYGASECGGICYDRPGGAAERGTVGEPVAGVTIELLGACGGGGCGAAEGGEGRVAVRSPAVAAGYLGSGGREDGERLAGGRYLTDDLAAWRGGELALVGRLNDLINVKGKKVNPREVEQVLAGHAAIEEVVVTAAAGEAREPVVRAVIACRPGSLSPEEVVRWCRQRLAEHKVPRSVLLVDELPHTGRGKLDRSALAGIAPRERLEAAAAPEGPAAR
ncbi:MAG TPA: class I adenylate-forming enzyme family protein [Thermoanaerobaculia bacterium]